VNFERFLETVEELLTQDPPTAPALISEAEFYEGYRQRLEKKLDQKITQIARDEHLVDTLPELERPTFKASLQAAITERDEIQRLLDEIQIRLEGTAKSD